MYILDLPGHNYLRTETLALVLFSVYPNRKTVQGHSLSRAYFVYKEVRGVR